MNLYLIKILGIIIVTICCIIAAYTDVKSQIIPNKLTFTTLILGISILSIYYIFSKDFNPAYYLSIILVYVFSYILWRLGVWAGGDVKLFTAISTLLVPEFLDVLPCYTVYGITLPFNLFLRIPTLLLIFNSIISIIPVVLIYVSIIIIKDKPHLKDELIKSFNFKEVFLSLNSLIVAYTIISKINVYHPIIKILFLLVISYCISKIMKYDIILTIFTITLIIQQLFIGNIITYMIEFLIISLIITVRNIYKKRIFKEALTEEIKVSQLKEGMILQYPLYYKENQYYFDKSSWYDFKEKGKLICSNNARGITTEEIQLLKENFVNSVISIKKGLPFAPFILAGLILTYTIGNTYQLLIYLAGLI